MAQDATLSLSEPPAAHRLRVRATYASLAVAAVLIAAKLVVWISTDSVALLSSLVDSFVDAAASLVNFFAVRRHARPRRLSPACHSPYRLDRGRRRRTALPQRSDPQSRRDRDADARQHAAPADPRSAVRRRGWLMDHLWRGKNRSAVASAADGPRDARYRARARPRDRGRPSRGHRGPRHPHTDCRPD